MPAVSAGRPWARGFVCGLMTALGGLGHTMPYLIPRFEVATAVGFHDQSHLTRHFKRTIGVTPARYIADLTAPPLGDIARSAEPLHRHPH